MKKTSKVEGKKSDRKHVPIIAMTIAEISKSVHVQLLYATLFFLNILDFVSAILMKKIVFLLISVGLLSSSCSLRLNFVRFHSHDISLHDSYMHRNWAKYQVLKMRFI